MGVIAETADRVLVMYAGRIVEEAPVARLFDHPLHPYTRGLLACVPSLEQDQRAPGGDPRHAARPGAPPARLPLRAALPLRRSPACARGDSRRWTRYEPRPHAPPASASASCRHVTPLIEAAGLTKHFPVRAGGLLRRHSIAAARGGRRAICAIQPGETLGLVGESGCGKSTLGRLLIRLIPATAGNILFDGADITLLDPARTAREAACHADHLPGPVRRAQSAHVGGRHRHGAAADPRRPPQRRDPRARWPTCWTLVGLPARARDRFPHEFSGGQRQRIGIARALVLRPKFVVCDEPVSALDVSVQAQIVNLLQDLQGELGLTYLFIAHDLGVVKHISNRVAVMYLGKIVELADKRTLYAAAAASLHPGADRRRAGDASGNTQPGTQGTPTTGGRHPQRSAPAVRLPLPHPLPARDAGVPRAGTARDRARTGPSSGLPPGGLTNLKEN